jgi:flavin-dependent dehydrogenase
LTGDAAGLIDPFTGEGIYGAMWSGRRASARVIEATADDKVDAAAAYRDDIRSELLPDLRVSRKLYDLFHLCPWLWTQGIRLQPFWDVACGLLTGEESYSGANAQSGASAVLSLVYDSLKLASTGRGQGRKPLLLFGG